MIRQSLFPAILLIIASFPNFAFSSDSFGTGPLLKEFGANAKVKLTHPLSKEQTFKVVFDVAEVEDETTLNRKFNSLARFLNMHVRAGVAAENIQLALVVHSKAGNGLLNEKAFKKKFGQENPNAQLLKELMAHNVRVILCGQSAAYYQIDNQDLIGGVEMALSAMTAHALLQQEGYTLNPF
ncbi:DsrE family protein [Aliikangiella coralliicola]|uniref:DsrE family protein n=1 Tax=Aliikangiella coralliicola TaxID=2592383 RepID=A0A545UJ28_9GAMM|nr:DsrE family protein [Aliikangiella coralliicola]TQV89469.1 DsrE family protein [Aliikangiella coralliicola]